MAFEISAIWTLVKLTPNPPYDKLKEISRQEAPPFVVVEIIFPPTAMT